METIELREYLDPLRKWWWLLLLSTLLASASSFLYTSKQPPVYQASTTVMVGTALLNPNPNGTELGMAAQLATAYADIIRRTAIRKATQEALGLEWLPEYNAYAIPNTQLIEISVVDTEPERAQAVASELANQLIQQTPGGNPQQDRQSFLEEQLAQLEASITETNEEITRQEQVLAGLFSARQLADTRAQIAALESKISTLQANYATLLANSRQGATNTITIIDPAMLPTTPLASDLTTNTAVAALLGFALAAGGAYLMEYLDQSLRSEQEAARHLGLPTLGLIPRMSRREIRVVGPLATAGRRTPATDAYASLRLNVEAACDERPLQMVLVTSPAAKDGKSTVAANLSIDWARTGHTVILVDADLYHPSQQRLFNLPNQIGLTTALVNAEVHVGELIQPTEIKGLSVLTSGPILPNPTPLLAQESMRRLLTQLRQQADIVILDSPPVAAVVDASILALQADGVLLVISSGRTKREMARRTVDLLQQIRGQMLGVVLFNSPLERTLYKYYQHGYGRRVNLPETLGLHREWNSSSPHGQDVVKSVTLEYTNGDGRAASTTTRNPYS